MPVLGIPHTNITLMVCFSCLLTPTGEATAAPSSDHLTMFTSLRTQTLPQICTHQKKKCTTKATQNLRRKSPQLLLSHPQDLIASRFLHNDI